MTSSDTASPLHPVRLQRDPWGQLVMTTVDGQTFSGVVPVRAFPISDPDRWVSICDEHGQEIVRIDDIGCLAADVRKTIEQELSQREFVPVIRRILSATHHGVSRQTGRWRIADRGPTSFQLNNEDDVRRLDDDQASIVDAHGIRYLIKSVRKLDSGSRRILEHFSRRERFPAHLSRRFFPLPRFSDKSQIISLTPSLSKNTSTLPASASNTAIPSPNAIAYMVYLEPIAADHH